MKNRKSIIYALCLMFVMAIIFMFSSQKIDTSHALSQSISNRLEGVIESNTQQTFATPEARAEHFKKLKSDLDNAIRKNAHVFLYAMFGLFAFLLFASEGRGDYGACVNTLFFTMLYAMSDELHQCLTEGRGGRFQDVCIDVFGAALMLMIIYAVKNKKEVKRK